MGFRQGFGTAELSYGFHLGALALLSAHHTRVLPFLGLSEIGMMIGMMSEIGMRGEGKRVRISRSSSATLAIVSKKGLALKKWLSS